MCFSFTGRAAPSFVIAIAGAVAVVLGYVAREVFRVTPHQKSDEIVRQFARSAAAEVGKFRRAVRNKSRATPAKPVSSEEVDAMAARVVERLERVADRARERVELLEGITPRTRDNRLLRIQRRLSESKAAIAAAAGVAKNPPEPNSGPG